MLRQTAHCAVYMLHAAADRAQTIHILGDDTGVFVLLVYWTSRMRVVANIHVGKWNGDVLDVSKAIEQLGPRKCSQLLGFHALSVAIRCRTRSEN